MSPALAIALVILAVAAAVAAAALLGRRRRARAAERAPLDLPRPVVLVHGLAGFDHVGVRWFRQHYFRGVVDHLAAAGVPVHAPRLSPFASVPERAAQLAAFVRALPPGRVTLVAHSMGGLDARYAISVLGLHDRVAELVTIGTPHRGTPVAELAQLRPIAAVRRLAGAVGFRTDALDWLTPRRLARFNEEVPDVASVAYYSVIGRASPGRLWRNPLLLTSHLFLNRRAGENDGLVPASSQAWGRPLDDVPVDHLAQIGWSLRFRATSFYEALLTGLHGSAAGENPAPASPLTQPAPGRARAGRSRRGSSRARAPGARAPTAPP